MIQIYLLTLLLIIMLHIFFYHPNSQLVKSEHYDIRSYLSSISITIILSFIPIVNICILLLTIHSVLTHMGITTGFNDWYDELDERLEDWLNTKL